MSATLLVFAMPLCAFLSVTLASGQEPVALPEADPWAAPSRAQSAASSWSSGNERRHTMQCSRALILVPAVAMVCYIGLEAGQRPIPPIAVDGRDPNTPAAQKTDKSTGIAECDKYFAMVEACVATKKMSKEDQQAAEGNVNRLRMMLPIARTPQGRATLVERCTKSIELAQQDDKYGCYKTSEKPGGSAR